MTLKNSKYKTWLSGPAATVLVFLVGCQSPSAPDSISPKEFSPAEYQDFAWNSIMAAYPTAVRPTVEIRRVIGNEDFPSLFEDCMLNEGFVVSVNADTSFEARVPPDQDEPFSLAMYTCEATYPRPFLLSIADDRESGLILYEYYRDELLACLEGLGLAPEPLPSQQVFLASLGSEERYDPYASLLQARGGLSIDEWDSTNRLCPQRPAILGGSP